MQGHLGEVMLEICAFFPDRFSGGAFAEELWDLKYVGYEELTQGGGWRLPYSWWMER